MKFHDPTEMESDGVVALIYSETGVGKTVSSIQSLPTPMLIISCEPRDIRRAIRASGRDLTMGSVEDFPKKVNDYVIATYTTWDDLMSTIGQANLFTPFRSVIVDGLSQLMMNLSFEIETQAFEARETAKEKKKLVAETKLSEEGYGALANQMSRFSSRIGMVSQMGKYIVINALAEQRNNFSNEVQVYPSLMGKQFGKFLPGNLDMIGYAEVKTDSNGNLTYPPIVKFDPDGEKNFQCKWTGQRRYDADGDLILMHFPLDYRVIFDEHEDGGGETKKTA